MGLLFCVCKWLETSNCLFLTAKKEAKDPDWCVKKGGPSDHPLFFPFFWGRCRDLFDIDFFVKPPQRRIPKCRPFWWSMGSRQLLRESVAPARIGWELPIKWYQMSILYIFTCRYVCCRCCIMCDVSNVVRAFASLFGCVNVPYISVHCKSIDSLPIDRHQRSRSKLFAW